MFDLIDLLALWRSWLEAALAITPMVLTVYVKDTQVLEAEEIRVLATLCCTALSVSMHGIHGFGVAVG